jgi:hypothetical protein
VSISARTFGSRRALNLGPTVCEMPGNYGTEPVANSQSGESAKTGLLCAEWECDSCDKQRCARSALQHVLAN